MRKPVRAPGVIGTFASPGQGGPFPGVLALPGSAGGIPEYFLDMLVPAGFASLALAYITGPMGADLTDLGLPDDLYEIPLERVERALQWLMSHPDVRTTDGRVGLIGLSKGGELALLVAATFPDLVGPVVAYTPSSVIWQGVASGEVDQHRSSWSHRGLPLPFVPLPPDVEWVASDRGLSCLAQYERGLDQPQAAEAAAIPVERATGPLLVISGSDDQIWPAKRMCEMLVDRMNRCGRADDIRHLNYSGAGHMLWPWWSNDESPPPVLFDNGTIEAAAAADADARPQALTHLRSSLVNRDTTTDHVTGAGSVARGGAGNDRRGAS